MEKPVQHSHSTRRPPKDHPSFFPNLSCILYLHSALSQSVELCPNPPSSLPTQETVLGNVPFSQTAQCLLCRPRKTCQDEYVISISTLTCMMHGSVSKNVSHHFTTLANTKFPKRHRVPTNELRNREANSYAICLSPKSRVLSYSLICLHRF